MEAKTIGEFFGSLQQSQIYMWRIHLRSRKNSEHVILREYYQGIEEVLDTLIEDYMGVFGPLDDYVNILPELYCPVEYLTELREFCKSSKYLLKGESELESDLDAILTLINTTLYKLKNLVPSDDNTLSLTNFMKDKLMPEPKYPDLGCTNQEC